MSRKRKHRQANPHYVVNQFNVKLGLILENCKVKGEYKIYREWGDYINRDYKNLRKELLAEGVRWDRTHEVIQILKGEGR